MLNFTTKSRLFGPMTARAASARRRGKTCLNLEGLERRDLMSIGTSPPVKPPTPPPPGPMPPVLVNPPHRISPGSPTP
jgi:hypothetical protein